MTSNTLIEYCDHLAFELKYLLVAATTWQACEDQRTRGKWPPHLIVLAGDSAFVHARCLYEFFCSPSGLGAKQRAAFGRKLPFNSPLWGTYRDDLNERVMHPGSRRGVAKWADRDPAHLKYQVAAFAGDVLGLWEEFAAQADSQYADLLSTKSAIAVEEARKSARSLRINPLF